MFSTVETRKDLLPRLRIDALRATCYAAKTLKPADVPAECVVLLPEYPERTTALLKRLGLMTTVVAIALTVAACGRATEEQINQALGITPTPTMSAEQIAESTAAASATSAARELALSSPGAVAGDVTAGKRQFDTWCIGCHGPGGMGPDVRSPGSPGADVDPDTLLAMIREGENHTPPGPYKSTELSDKQIIDIAAYLHTAPGP